jgi:tetratricopeptide (TPR) repeat protein
MDAAQGSALTARWVDTMRRYTEYLRRHRSTQQVELAATLTVLELPNLFALLEQTERAGDSEVTIDLATSLFGLLQNVGKPRLLERVAKVRDAAAAALGATWNHASFEAQRTRIEEHLANSRSREALDGAQQLLQRARTAGEETYPDADYDLAGACYLLASVFKMSGASEQALPLLDEAQKRFETFERDAPSRGGERMACVCLTERGDCLRDLGRLDQAAAAYEESIHRDEKIGRARDVAVGKIQLGTVRMLQSRYEEALKAYEEAREQFTRLDDPNTVAVSWHQTGMVYQVAEQPEAAEDAYRKSLAISVRLGNVAGQAGTLVQLGNLYDNALGRIEESAAFSRQAADKSVEIGDIANEGRARGNLADALRKLGRSDEARQEILRAIECKAQFGHASEPWKAWSILAKIETDAGNATAGEANRRATAYYLAYRRDGGENHYLDGRICLDVTQSLLAGDPAAATSRLQELAARPQLSAGIRLFIRVLQSIVGGSRDRTLADTPGLDYVMAAEILFLLETLEKPQ